MGEEYSFQAPVDVPLELPILKVDPNAETSFFKNPDSDYKVNPSVNVTIVGEDDRVPVHVDEGYDSVVRLRIMDEKGQVGLCTGTIQNIEGYTHEGTIVTTAAHCILENATSIAAYGDYKTSEGYYEKFQLYNGEAYVHPNFAANNPDASRIINDATTDAAVIHFDEPIPDGVEPSTFVPLDISEFNSAMADLGNYNGIRGMTVNATGFSGDLIGLSVDEACSIYSGNNQSLLTTCDGAQGSSGGPNFLTDQDGGLILDENGQPMSVAVNSNSGVGVGGGKTAISSDFFDAVEVLEKVEICTPEGRVVAESGLNRREGPGTDYYEMLPDEDGTPSALPYGSEVGIVGEEGDWSMVIGEDGRMGFSSNKYIEPTGDCFEIEEGRTQVAPEKEIAPESEIIEGDFSKLDAAGAGNTALRQEAEEIGLNNNAPAANTTIAPTVTEPTANVQHFAA
jgi:hypothetical protein